jgi:hypothetical protein
MEYSQWACAKGEQVEDETKLTEILVSIRGVEVKVDGINKHLVQLNGSIQSLYGKADKNRTAIETAEKALLIHERDCPGLKTIAEIDRKLASGDFHGPLEVRDKLLASEKEEAERRGKEEANKNWLKLLQPWITWTILAILTVVMLHFSEVVKQMESIKGIVK